MSSTYVHYGTPSSLSADYAVLSTYAAAHSLTHDEPHAHVDEEALDAHDDGGVAIPGRSGHHRMSFASTHRTPFNPTLPPVPDTSRRSGSPDDLPTETTPLLFAPPAIQIEEACDDEDENDPPAPSKIFAEEVAVLARYTLPVFGTQLFEYSLVIASVVSIGHLSTTALAASTLGSMTASVTGFSIIQGFVCALDTMLPSAWTSSQPQLVGLWAQRMTVVMAFVLIPIFFCWFASESILLWLRQEPEVARLASLYLRCLSIGLPGYAFNSISRRYFQSQGLFTVPTRIILIVAPINAVLNYALVWGPEPIRLGFIGAPIATGVSMNLISLCSIIYGTFYAPRIAWHPLSTRAFTSLGVLVQLGLSGVGQVASEWWSWELVGLAASQLGPIALATQSVLLVSASTTYQAPFALSVATSVRIGNLLGEENPRRARVAAQASLLMSLAISLVWSAMFMLFRGSWARLFNDDAAVVSMVAAILPLVALFQVFDGLGGVTGGILRASGKQFAGALLNLSAYYVIGIPFGIWLAFWRGMALAGLWVGLTVSLVYCAAIGVYICLRTDWEREVEKIRRRIAADKKHDDDVAARA